MKTINKLFLLSLITFILACDSDDDPIDPVNQRLTEGFIVTGTSEDGTTVFAQYFEELPSGAIDLTQGQAFQFFSPADVYDGAVYTSRTDGSNGLAKMVVDGNGEIIEEGFIATTESTSLIRVRDSNTGMYVDPNTPSQIKVFDPQTLQETGNVDLSAAPVFSDPLAEVRTSSAVFRGDNIFVVNREPVGGAPLDNFTMVRGSLSSGTFGNQLNSTTGPTSGFNPIFRLTDEQGNLYVHHQGDLSPFGNPGGILKIPAGSNEFDPNYDFRVVLDPTLFLQVMRGFVYYQNGIAYAQIAFETPARVVDIITNVGGIRNLTDDQIDEILFLLDNEENAGWVEVDLNAQQIIRKVPGIPQLSTFAVTNVQFIDNVPHFVIKNSTVNAFYRYDPTMDQSEVVFSATGASLNSVIDLSANNLR
ncbi:MAG: hypothetical protein AAF620_10770 [Bacteroidota bacterium]